MNNVYKLIWSVSQNAWIVCSELGRKKKSACRASILIASLVFLLSPVTYGSTCGTSTVPDNGFACSTISAANTPSGDYGLLGKKSIYYTSTAEGYGKNFVLENQNINITNLKYESAGLLLGTRGYDSGSVRYSTLTGNNLSVVADGSNAGTSSIAGLSAGFGGSVYFNNVDLTFLNANNGDINGLMAGQAYNDSGSLSSNNRTNYIEVNNDYTFKAIKTSSTNTNPVTGIRAIQNNDGTGSSKTGVGPTAHVVIKGDYSADITAAYGNGVYVSGKDTESRAMPTVELLGNTSITLHGGGNALHIGKKNRSLGNFYIIRDGWGAGQIVFGENSNVNIDQSDAKGEAIILAFGGSKLEASKTKEFKVRSQDSAIRVGTDFLTQSVQDSTTEISANINNADFALSNDTLGASLLAIDNNQADVKFNFTGDKTQLIASKQGALLQVGNSSNIDMGVSEGKIQGLTEMGTNSSIDLKLNNSALWQLAKKGTETQSTFTTLELNDSTLNGFDVDSANWGVSDFILKGQTITSNNGVINLDNGKVGDKLKIDGNYVASGNATVKMNTLWNAPGDVQGTNSVSDVLKITGTATGMTTVVPVSANGTLNLIDGNIQQIQTVINTTPVIYVEKAGNQSFQGNARTTGISQVQLAMRNNQDTNADEYYWTAKAKDKDVDIYNPETSGYVQMPVANMELGYTTLATLHERRGENQTLAWDECGTCVNDNNGQSWGRIVGSHLDLEGKNRFNMSGEQYLVQIGHDFIIHENIEKQSRNHTGAYISYGRSDIDFEDRYRAINGQIVSNKKTGNGKTDAFSLGLYNTYYDKNGSYLDLIGQVSHLRNTYETAGLNDVKQNGIGAAFSAEIGRPYALTKHIDSEAGWLIEPQAQLTYQYLGLDSFKDDIRNIDQNDQHGLRGRLGVRVAHNSEAKSLRTNTVYFTANVLHDFLDQKDINIGPDSIRENYNNTWGSVGIGIQKPVSQHSYLYADVRYEHSFTSDKRESYKGTVGLKFTWK
ncbi:autotransporter outer membrane beta-barrel domain-containing protein [Morganella morganii]|uniref:autotransporter outer membrane beta-barrel domain-containing protein n=2 Tax=Morganella morganii TaxID=582 RepID=UPI001BDAF1B2|nr:autotransporter outer membrane beta-barrel domain-containing protein [Morganella morganii]MBT0347534.1 autotransporter outer membrane beta-barrel domain-containing protein [Morganella morganii subsp. morganii]MBV7313994.1 autotransporter outer membrane beta-barrel domain-containing protein [Morganella morganii]